MNENKKTEWGEIVYFLDRWCFGIAPDLRTICLGKETEVKEMLVNPEKQSPNLIVNEILDTERNLREEINDGIQRPSAIRSRIAGETKHRVTHIKSASFRKRTAVHKA